jgi:hypothetical protein
MNTLLFWRMQCLKPTFFPMDWNNDVWVCNNSGDGTDQLHPSAGVAGVGFDATYDLVINTLTRLEEL